MGGIGFQPCPPIGNQTNYSSHFSPHPKSFSRRANLCTQVPLPPGEGYRVRAKRLVLQFKPNI